MDPTTVGSQEKNWAKEKVRSAFRLIKSIEERQRTIYKVAESIVRQLAEEDYPAWVIGEVRDGEAGVEFVA